MDIAFDDTFGHRYEEAVERIKREVKPADKPPRQSKEPKPRPDRAKKQR